MGYKARGALPPRFRDIRLTVKESLELAEKFSRVSQRQPVVIGSCLGLLGSLSVSGFCSVARAAEPDVAPRAGTPAIIAPAVKGPATGLADSAALRATVFGTPPQDIAPLPDKVPLVEIDLTLPWAKPVPEVFWFDRRLHVWFSAQDKAAPLAIVIAGTGGGGNTAILSTLRAVLYGAGYHVLTMPSPTFPRFIVAASSTGVAGDLRQDGEDLYATMQRVIAHLPRKTKISEIDVLGYSLGGTNAAVVKSIDSREHKLNIRRVVMINPSVSLFDSVGRLDKLFAASIGSGDAGVERLYQKLYVQLANLYRSSDNLEIDENFLLTAAAAVLKTDAEILRGHRADFPHCLDERFLRGRSLCRYGRGRRSAPHAQSRRFFRRYRTGSARQTVLGIFYKSVRAVLLEASPRFDHGFFDRR